MKFLKTLGILLLFAIGVAIILVMVLPVKQKTERSIIINANPAIVYDYLSKLANFNKWAIWNQTDTSIINTITGTDGTLGAINNWKGDPALSGEGKIQITSLEINQEIEHHIIFTSPKAMEADAEFDLQEINGQTKVIWSFELATPRPSNIFNLFKSMDQKMSNDLDKSLSNLKALLEKNNPGAVKNKTYEVLPMNFPSTSFAFHRQMVKWNEIPGFFAQHIPQLYDASLALKVTPGSPSGLFYVWDEENQQADMAAAIPVAEGTLFSDTTIQVISIPGSKAVYIDHYGAYDKFAEAYNSLDKYLAANNLKKKFPLIEQYITDPKLESDTSKWLTKIICLVE
ncbi:MAG TPA: GyrI-like domain-containing protein [Chitinophagaceae bacterium]